jgi:hypothetical protein
MSASTRSVAVAVKASTGGDPSVFSGGAEREEGGTEVVSPFRQAMRFVHDEQVHMVLPQPFEEGGIFEPLRGGEDEFHFRRLDGLKRILQLGRVNRGIHLPRPDAERPQLVGLVLHQRDQRRDDNCDTRQVQRGQLITERFACAGRHDGDRVAAVHDRADDVLLSRPELVQPERSAHQLFDGTKRRAAHAAGTARSVPRRAGQWIRARFSRRAANRRRAGMKRMRPIA